MRRARLAVVALVAIVGGATAVRAQLLRLPSVMPGRAGTGSFLWFNRAFPDLDVEIFASQDYSDHRYYASALLVFHNERRGHCFVVPDGLQVTFNGHVLEVDGRGGEAHGRVDVSGIDIGSLFPCRRASFRSRKDDPIDPHGPARVTLDLGTKHAETSSATFFDSRRLVLRSATARAGDTVIVDAQPRSENRVGASPTIRLEKSRGVDTELFESNGVTHAAGTWRFVLPRLAPGRYKVHAGLTGANLAVVDACHGVHRCLAEIPSFAYVSLPELNVVE